MSENEPWQEPVRPSDEESTRALKRMKRMRVEPERVELAEEELSDSEALLRGVVETAVDGIIIIDERGAIESFNPAAEKLFGYEAEEMIGKNVNLLMPAPYREEHDSYLINYLQTGVKKIIGIGREVTALRSDGTTFPVELAISEVRLSGKRRLFTGFVRDISERRAAAEALASEKELLSVTLQSVGDGVITFDLRGRVILINKVAEELTGWSREEAAGMRSNEVFRVSYEVTGKPIPDPVRRVLELDEMREISDPMVLHRKDGSERLVIDICAPIHNHNEQLIGVVVAFRDVTERARMEEELRKAQRLESIGILAGGVAHDFNNYLSEIACHVNLAKMLREPEEEGYDYLTEAEGAAIRAQGLTQQLLTFAKGGEPNKDALDVSRLLREHVRFALTGSAVHCEFDLPEELWPVEADEGQIAQVLNNLVINALYAMPEGGRIAVSARNVKVNGGENAPLSPGRYVRFSVADQGIGIAQEHLEKIFDPYFTTKEEGTGLGLAVSYSIVKKHGGQIQVSSSRGSGATFRIDLPASDKPVAKQQKKLMRERRGGEKILLMDDNDGLRVAASKVLRRLGYEVESARDGEEAIGKYQKALELQKPFDAVLIDLTIAGGMGGKETMSQLLALDSKVKGVAASGYSTDPIIANYAEYGFIDAVAKPYSKSKLSDILQRVFERTS